MRKIYMVGTDGFAESLIIGKFSTTDFGTIGIIKSHYDEMYGDGNVRYKDFEFGGERFGTIDVTFKMAIVWGHEDKEDWDEMKYYIYVVNNVTNG